MRYLLLTLTISWRLIAQDKSESNLKAEIESLKAQIQQLRLEYGYAIQVCTAPDLMAARLAVIETNKKVEATKLKPEVKGN